MKYEPNFDCIHGAVSGYDTEDCSPSKKNLRVMQKQLFANFFNGLEPVENWDQVIRSIEGSIGFWKQMYCGLYEMADWEKENSQS